MLIRFLFIISFITFTIQLQGQSVGLVLSGGGAKGIAHIGVIKALEENNIPIDFIAGTSIGAMVGGLYAIGITPEEMEEIFSSEDFKRWSYGHIDIHEEYYYKRKNESSSWINIPIVNQDGEFAPQLPSNIISPAQMDLRFLQFLEPANAAANYNFDSLMVPFFCIATDVYNNKPVIHTNGSLSSAVRSSMTFPGYFKPITMDSTLLFDGGMENNFPADIMIERYKPDFIIGSKVARNPQKPDADDIYQQLQNVFMKYTDYNLPDNGFLIEPDVKEYSLLDFNQYDSIYQRGYLAAIQAIDSIKKLIPVRTTKEQTAKKRSNFTKNYRALNFQNIYITGVSDETVDYISRNIKRNRIVLSFEEFEKEYFKLLSDKLIKSIYPRAIYNKALGNYDLYLDIKTQNEFSFELGGNISSNVRNLGFAGFDYIFQKKNIYNLSGNFVVGKFYNSIHAKFRMDFPPRTLSRDKTLSPFFIDISATHNNWSYFTTTADWFIDNDAPIKTDQSESHFQSNFGRPIFNRGLFYTGFSYGRLTDNYFHTNTIERDFIADETQLNYSSVHATFEYSTLNYKQYANTGKFARIQTRYITGQELYKPGSTAPANIGDTTLGHGWYKIKMNYERYINFSKHFSLGGKAEALYTTKNKYSNSMATLLHQTPFHPFPQSKVSIYKNSRGDNWLALGVIPIFHLNDRFDIRTEGYIFQPYQKIQTDNFTTSFGKTFPAPNVLASVAAIFHTPLGPLALTSSYFMGEQTEFFFQLNFGYLLFNKRGVD